MQPISARPFRLWKWKSNGSESGLPLDDNHQDLLFSQPLHFTSPHSQDVFADCRIFLVTPSSSLVFQFSTHFLLIPFLAFNLVLLEVATCRLFFRVRVVEYFFFRKHRKRVDLIGATSLSRCRHTIPITDSHNVVQHDGYPEGAATAQLRPALRCTIMAYLRQGLHVHHGLPSAGL